MRQTVFLENKLRLKFPKFLTKLSAFKFSEIFNHTVKSFIKYALSLLEY